MESNYKNRALCIIIPVFNEEKNIGMCITKIMEVIVQTKTPVFLLIVNDGSSDNTKLLLDKFAKEYANLIIIDHNSNKGYGAALQTGIKEANDRKFEFGLFMDCDMTNDPKYILDFVEYIATDYDCIKASRYIAGGKTIGVPILRQIISKVGNALATLLFSIGVKDCTNGFRMVRLKLLREIVFYEKGFAIILEELFYLKKQGAKFIEIPVILTSRTNSASKFTYDLITFWNYLKYALKAFLI